jgi:dihydrofolate reductase
MRKLIYTNMASLDGFVEDADGSLDWVIIDEELHTFVNEQERETGAFLYGRRTYEVMAGFWPTADADPANPPFIIEYARIWKQIPLFVFSRTLERVEGNATLIKEVSVDSIMAMKEQPGKNLEVGGANLASTFIKLGLIDEFRLFIQPVILGAGKPMYPVLSDKINLNLVEDRRFSSGVVYLHYQKVSE